MIPGDQTKSSSSSQSLSSILTSSNEPTPPQTDSSNKSDLKLSSDKSKANTPSDPSSEELKKFLNAEPADLTQTILSSLEPKILKFNKEKQRFEDLWSRQEKQVSSSKETDSFLYLLDNLEQLDFEFREYQEEIHKKSQDKNSIIVLGTGSGKTIISILHIVDCLKKHGNLKKVAFLNNQVSLVEQQAKKIKGFLESMTESPNFQFIEKLKPKVLVLHGGKGEDAWDDFVQLKELPNPIILAMTPQYLLNGLRKGQINFSDIALVVFDECHHCTGRHVYNQIMEEFYFWPSEFAPTEKPQILGLTATPILTPKKITDVDIPKKLMEICMNLDSSFVTLDDKEKDLKNREAELVIWPYQQDSFLETIDILSDADQRKLVNYLMEKDILKTWGVTATHILKCLNQNPENESQDEEIPTLKIGMSIKEYFESKMANRAIALLLELGEYAVYLYFSDVYRRLDSIWRGFGCKSHPSSHVSRLRQIKELLQSFLQKISSYNNRYKLTDKCNVFLTRLKNLFVSSNDRIGIVFVERKYMARVLDKIINELTSGSIKAHHVIGHNQKGIVMDDDESTNTSQKSTNISSNQSTSTATSTYSLTEVQDLKTTGKQFGKLFNPRQGLKTQLKQIDLFKEGEYDLLIATSIIQEGFDVPNCNFVIAYSEPKTALDLVQMRGRARRENSQFYVFVPSKKVREKEDEYIFQFDLMKRIKYFTQTFKLGPANKKASNPNLRQTLGENGCRINNNWSSTLSLLLCRSMPPNSLEEYRPFHLIFEGKNSQGQKNFTCLMMLPNQSNVRLSWGEKHFTKADAKSSAAYYCCRNLKAQNYFDEFLNPKSFNKDQLEFIDLDINPFVNQFDSQRIGDVDPDFHSFFSHFTKKYHQENSISTGYLYEIILKENPQKICLVLQDELPPGYSLKTDTLTLQFIRPISFTLNEYKNYVLIHRYLVSLINSPTLLEFFRTLTDEDPIYFKFEDVQINHLDARYELAMSHEPSLSFFLFTNSNYEIDQDFQQILTKYITYQSKIYQFVNSIDTTDDYFGSIWDFPSGPEFQITEKETAPQFILQDVWKLGKYKFESIEDLKKVDFLASTDGNLSLQHRCLFYIDPLLDVTLNSNNYTKGFEVSHLDNHEKKNIFVNIELMKSPISLELYDTLKSILHELAAFEQAEISVALFLNLTKDQLANKSKKKLEWKIDPNKLLKSFEQFKDQIYDLKTIIFKFYQPPEASLQNQPNYQENNSQKEQEALKELQNAFILENDSVSNRYFDGVGNALINLLTTIEVVFENPEEWSYSLERIRNKKLQDWKDRSSYLRETSKFFISKQANQYLYDALIFQQDEDKIYSEYLKQKAFIRVIKIYACMLYKKETCLIQTTREYLHKIGLLKSTYPKIKILNKDANDRSGLIQSLYNQKYRKLEGLIDYSFKNKFLLVNAFLEISFRDFYVEWIQEKSNLYKNRNIKLSEERKKAFQTKQDETTISVESSVEYPSDFFSNDLVSAINFYHDRPNQMDTFRWLGQALVQFVITEWVYETYSSLPLIQDLELRMRAKYFSGSRFIPLVSWHYCLEGCLLAPSVYPEKLSKLKQDFSAKDLLTQSLYSDTDKSLDELRILCYISSSLFYSLLGAIYIDSFMDLQETRRIALRLLVPVILENEDAVFDFAPLRIQAICEDNSLPNPVIRKVDLNDKVQSFKYPASSEYQLWIGDTKYASLVENSLINSEYALYVKALEELYKIY